MSSFKHLTKNEQQALLELRKRLQKTLGDNFIALYLFGSKARGDFNQYSDIDVLVLVKRHDFETHERAYDIAWDVEYENDFSLRFSVLTIDEDEWQQHQGVTTRLYRNIQKEGVMV